MQAGRALQQATAATAAGGRTRGGAALGNVQQAKRECVYSLWVACISTRGACDRSQARMTSGPCKRVKHQASMSRAADVLTHALHLVAAVILNCSWSTTNQTKKSQWGIEMNNWLADNQSTQVCCAIFNDDDVQCVVAIHSWTQGMTRVSRSVLL
jgi:hypothetical protein